MLTVDLACVHVPVLLFFLDRSRRRSRCMAGRAVLSLSLSFQGRSGARGVRQGERGRGIGVAGRVEGTPFKQGVSSCRGTKFERHNTFGACILWFIYPTGALNPGSVCLSDNVSLVGLAPPVVI